MEISSVKLNFVSEIARPCVTLFTTVMGATDYSRGEACTLGVASLGGLIIVIKLS